MSGIGLFEAVKDSPGPEEGTALIANGRRWTLRRLLEAAEEVATRLQQSYPARYGVSAQITDPVAAAAVALGCDLAGVPVVHRDPSLPAAPGCTVQDRRPPTEEGREPDWFGTRELRLWTSVTGDSGLPAGLPAGAQIFLTSGSTGSPVGVVRTADAVLADARRVARVLGYAPDSPVVVAAPQFHNYGFNYGVMAPLLLGAPARFCSPRAVPSQLARAVREHDARTLVALPAHYGLLAQGAIAPDGMPDAGLADLCNAVSAGAPLADGVAERIAGRFPFTLYNCYGSSEAGAVTLMPVRGTEEPGQVGVPLPGVEARTVAVHEASSVGEAGELLLRTDSLAAWVMDATELVALGDDGGWHRTGDLATVDAASGEIRLRGRMGLMINVAGKKVSPQEVEDALSGHPAVAEAQVLAAPDSARGQVPVARVVLCAVVSTEVLHRWCRDRLAPHQVPRRIEVVTALPRSATGKLVRDIPGGTAGEKR
ncbi:fatty acid--CoA ligase family protein [Streptomyces pathocidini]|uniref:class I adenylate-forming enzyme family protein n=1 Tax=Streptomyces pathocidini TaxID=1650571 RepID=UPI0033E1E136